MQNTNINELMKEEIARPAVPQSLHDKFTNLSEVTKISLQRLYAEALLKGFKTISKKYSN